MRQNHLKDTSRGSKVNTSDVDLEVPDTRDLYTGELGRSARTGDYTELDRLLALVTKDACEEEVSYLIQSLWVDAWGLYSSLRRDVIISNHSEFTSEKDKGNDIHVSGEGRYYKVEEKNDGRISMTPIDVNPVLEELAQSRPQFEKTFEVITKYANKKYRKKPRKAG